MWRLEGAACAPRPVDIKVVVRRAGQGQRQQCSVSKHESGHVWQRWAEPQNHFHQPLVIALCILSAGPKNLSVLADHQLCCRNDSHGFASPVSLSPTQPGMQTGLAGAAGLQHSHRFDGLHCCAHARPCHLQPADLCQAAHKNAAVQHNAHLHCAARPSSAALHAGHKAGCR